MEPTTNWDTSVETGLIDRCRCPSRCFCKYDTAELLEIGEKKLRQHIPTIELLRHARSTREKELVCVVSMLDLDDVVAEIMIREHMADAACDVMACRDELRNRLLAALDGTLSA
ncbi:MAG TPA: hypothetical protein VGA56_14705 [Opitutaceae bacterium]